MYRSILLPPEVLPAFGCFKCSDLTHPIAASIFDNTNVPNVADCVLEEKWAIVNQAGKWGISHENCIEEIYPLKFWNDAYVAPVDMTALVSSHKGVAEMEMEKLKMLPINVEAKELASKKKRKAVKLAKKAEKSSEEGLSVGSQDWEIVEVEGIDEDYVLLN